MTKSELNKFKHILEAKQAELATFVRNREGIAIEKSPDALDEVQHAAERELAIRNLDRESNLLRNVRAALRRTGFATDSTPKRISVPNLEVDFDQRRVIAGGRTVQVIAKVMGRRTRITGEEIEGIGKPFD